MQARAQQKSSLIYNTIESSGGFYKCTVCAPARSRMNIPFRLAGGEDLEAKFLKESKQKGMIQLKGHR